MLNRVWTQAAVWLYTLTVIAAARKRMELRWGYDECETSLGCIVPYKLCILGRRQGFTERRGFLCVSLLVLWCLEVQLAVD